MKIVSLLPSATEILCALDLEDSIAAITHECDFPPHIAGKPAITSSKIDHETMTSKEIDHAVRTQLDGHGSIYGLDTKPDLIITQELCDVCAVNYKTVQKAAKIYVADAQVVSLEPNTIGDIFENIRTVGEITDTISKVEEVVAELETRLQTIREKTANIENRPKVFMLEWLEPPFAPGHWVPEQVEIAGGSTVLGKAGERSVATTYEAIRESNPDVMVLIPCGYYTSDILRQLKNTYFPANWKDINAVKNGEIWALDATSYFSRPGPRVIDGAEILAKIIHPAIFGTPLEHEAIRAPPEMLRFQSRP
ncbi:MAG: cobalamin-binding protein [Saprospiraceae bacterium]|nr:cobalamin-binding protein [Pyrinomonadaceae bacterium]